LDAQWQTASDQYSLAVVVYHWLSGALPFPGSSFPEVAVQHVRRDPSSLGAKVPSLPPEVEQVVFKSLAKDPKERFPTIQAFATALEEACHAA
jgi:serine/threonine protein kinase